MPSLKRLVIEGTALTAATNVVTRLVSFGTVLVTTHALTIGEYGTVGLALSLLGPIAALAALGLDELVLTDTARALGEGRHAYAKTFLTRFYSIKFSSGAALLVVAWIARPSLVARYGSVVEEFFLLLGALFFLQMARTSIAAILQTHARFRPYSLMSVAEVFAKFLVTLLFAYGPGLTVARALVAFGAAESAAALVGAAALPGALSYFRTVPMLREPVFRRMLRAHGKWHIVVNVTSSWLGTVRLWTIRVIAGVEAVGTFSFIQTLYSAVAQLLPVKPILSPILAGRSAEKGSANFLMQRATKYAVLFYGALTAAAIVAAPIFLDLFFPKYRAAYPLFALLMLQLPLAGFSISQNPMLLAMRAQKQTTVFSAVLWTSTVLLLPAMTRNFGLTGAILENHLSTAAVVLLKERVLARARMRSFVIRQFFSIDAYDRELLAKIIGRLRRGKPGGQA